MISDEERKRAVKFLRERECVKLDCHECYQMSEMLLGRQNALCAIDEQWGALADLIDRPTCRKVIPDEMEGYVFCSECGAEIGEYGVPNYCHNCGAEVIE